MPRPSIFELVGGEPAFLRLAAAHHERCLQDPVLNHPFSHPGHPQHVERLAGYWIEVFGGPPRYTELGVEHSAMLEIHAHNGPVDDMGPRFLDCFVQAADDADLPPVPELRQALRDYMTWAVSDVMAVFPFDAPVPTGLPVPHWSWDGLEN